MSLLLDDCTVKFTYQGFIQQKNESENGPFKKIGDLKTDPKIKSYNVIFHTRSAANEFTRKLLHLKKITKIFFTFFLPQKYFFIKLQVKFTKIEAKKKKKTWMDP